MEEKQILTENINWEIKAKTWNCSVLRIFFFSYLFIIVIVADLEILIDHCGN